MTEKEANLPVRSEKIFGSWERFRFCLNQTDVAFVTVAVDGPRTADALPPLTERTACFSE